jgi:hypothetical protein
MSVPMAPLIVRTPEPLRDAISVYASEGPE